MRKPLFLSFYIFLLQIILWSCSSDPASSTVKYPQATVQNFDVNQLTTAINELATIPGMKSIVVGRNGVIAAEEYFNDGGAEEIHDVRSVTKSVMALLIGIAISDGYINSTDQTIGELLGSELVVIQDSSKAAITIENILAMSSGLEWHELDGGNSYSRWYNSIDPIKWVLDQSFIHTPGNGFNYNTGSIHLLSAILTLSTGQSALEYARTKLFEPLGIDSIDWTVITKPARFNNGGAGLKISPRAMFALGNLMLNNGKKGQLQIVPETWVNKCKTTQNNTNNEIFYAEDYGYLWWVGHAHGHNLYFANGYGGQFVVCVPDFDLVIVASCTWQSFTSDQAGQNWYNIYTKLMDEIATSVRE